MDPDFPLGDWSSQELVDVLIERGALKEVPDCGWNELLGSLETRTRGSEAPGGTFPVYRVDTCG